MLLSETRLMSFVRSLIIASASLFLVFVYHDVRAAEWQELGHGSTRIKSAPPEEADPGPALEIPEGHYAPGEGTIESAFGIEFGVVIPDHQIERFNGWHEPPRLPAKPKYIGLVTPFTMESLTLLPPVQPPQLAKQNTGYTAWIDFDRKPIAIETNTFNNAEEVIDIIARKYGEPDEVDGDHLTYRRAARALHIYKLPNDKAFLRYEDTETLEPYMHERNLSLKRKFRENQTERLSPIEQEVIELANQLETFREDHGAAFGLPFGKRIGFRAAPDEFVPFDAPSPLKTFDQGEYRIMVSPDLMPIAVRYQVTGDEAFLALTKKELELAMELAFAGFLKQTPHHTVLTFKAQAYTLLIRKGKFQFTVHERQENADRNEREKLARLAAAEAKKEKERLAELQRQQAAIAARQRQIEEEKAF